MGTQFWWFYDVLILTITAGLLYNAVVKGFNKLMFQLIGFVLAFVIGFFGSSYLAEPTYSMLFRENIAATIQAEYETMDLYELMAQNIRQAHAEGDLQNTDRAMVQEMGESIAAGGDAPDWFLNAVSNVIHSSISRQISPYPNQEMKNWFAEHPEELQAFLSASGDPAVAAETLEKSYFRPFYVNMVRMALFLLLEAVVLIIVGIISGMVGNPEDLMHIRRFNRALAVPVGLVEVACVLISFTVAVRLVVAATDNMMLLFNEETIAETKIFQLLYQKL